MDHPTLQTLDPVSDISTLAAVIARSPIWVCAAESRLPPGYDATDIAILDWIAEQAREATQRFALM